MKKLITLITLLIFSQTNLYNFQITFCNESKVDINFAINDGANFLVPITFLKNYYDQLFIPQKEFIYDHAINSLPITLNLWANTKPLPSQKIDIEAGDIQISKEEFINLIQNTHKLKIKFITINGTPKIRPNLKIKQRINPSTTRLLVVLSEVTPIIK